MPKAKKDAKADDYPLARIIRESAHNIWLAGLGAYARAEEEGSRLFDGLVALGETMERKAREQVTRPIRAAERTATDVRTTATDTWDRLESIFEQRVAKALNSLQIPTHRDVAELTRRVEDLQKSVNKLGSRLKKETSGDKKASAGQKKAAGRKKTATRKTARRSATRKKPAARRRAG